METLFTKNLGKRIRELRLAKGFKQSFVADCLDMERSNFTKIESGKQAPTDKNLEKIANILGVSLKDLFDFEHLKSKEELISELKFHIDNLSEKEVQFLYKTVVNIILLR